MGFEIEIIIMTIMTQSDCKTPLCECLTPLVSLLLACSHRMLINLYLPLLSILSFIVLTQPINGDSLSRRKPPLVMEV